MNFGLAEIEEMRLELNLKITGKAGLPVLAETATERSFTINLLLDAIVGELNNIVALLDAIGV
ncbi:CU044_2847 family protein [Leptodesmis sp.]|uniref:CU044_2847 family protein n=1 Tax=Leptodesmis sp. TaxID=3100501 RepID=UPI0040534BB1